MNRSIEKIHIKDRAPGPSARVARKRFGRAQTEITTRLNGVAVAPILLHVIEASENQTRMHENRMNRICNREFDEQE